MNLITRLRNKTISIPDYRSISKRSISLPRHVLSKPIQPGSFVIVDATGLKVYGKAEWHQEKRDVTARRTSHKLHLAVNEHHQIVACEPTGPEVGNSSSVSDLLTQTITPFEIFMGDGAYDGEPVLREVLNHQPSAQVVVPPHETAVCSVAGDTQPDHHIQVIAHRGRLAWRKITGYNLRNYAELTVQRCKRNFGNAVKARALPQQKAEACISVSTLNRMIHLGMPISVKV